MNRAVSDTYTFSGIAGQRVNFDQLSAAPALAVISLADRRARRQ